MRVNSIIETSRGIQAVDIRDRMYCRRVLYFTDEFNRETCCELNMQLMLLESEAPGEPIMLYIDSPGGSVDSGLAIYDTIRMMSSPVTTVVAGMAASMGSIVFLAGEKRIMLPHSRLLIHDPYIPSGTSGKPLILQEELEKLMKVREQTAKIIAERTGQTLDWVYEKTKSDYIMDAQEALACGAATALGSFVRGTAGCLLLPSEE